MSLTINDSRNIIDHYKYWTHEAIMTDLDTRRNNFSVLCCNLLNDFNIATVVRNSNAFLAKEVLIYGNKRYDRRGTVGTHIYTNFKHVKEIDDLKSEISNLYKKHKSLRIVGVDNVQNSFSVNDYSWSKDDHVLMVFGQEQVGIPEEVLEICHDKIYIKQYGSVRSLNVGTASGVAMYDYCSKTVN
jgi:tRNA G18 (ribose-2'-O)-methylase SpoU